MVLKGTVKNGVVVLDEGPVPPDGTVVQVEVDDNGREESVGKRLMKFAGMSWFTVNWNSWLVKLAFGW